MAKASASTRFRKVDVDQFNEDNYQDELMDGAEEQGPNESEVQRFLNQKNGKDALRYVLELAPLATKDQATKEKALTLTMRVMKSISQSEITNAISSLEQPLQDVLMKYIYRGFEIPSETKSVDLLVWHEKAFQIGGIGSVVRVLTDRKRV